MRGIVQGSLTLSPQGVGQYLIGYSHAGTDAALYPYS